MKMLNTYMKMNPVKVAGVALGLMAYGQQAVAQLDSLEFDDVEALPVAINSDAEEVMPLFTNQGNTMYFVRQGSENNTGGKEGGLDIWMATRDDNGTWSEPNNNFPTLNNEGDNAIIGISQNADKVYLLNAYKEQKVGEAERGFATASKSGNGWAKPTFIQLEDFTTNSPYQTYYVAPEGDLIIMAVKMDNTLGEEDLYISTYSGGAWSKPEHMGATINSTGFEMSPYLSEDRKHLFFSSNGHDGMGDADIFVAERIGEGWTNWSKPRNLGDKINSNKFDAYFTLAGDSTFFFASNREGGMSNLYSVKIAAPELIVETIDTVVVDTVTVVPGTTIITPQNIYFDLDKYSLRGASKEILDKLAADMKTYPDVKVEIQGHADIQYTDAYNDRLSKNRSTAAYKYLVKQGIDEDRLKIVYFGESRPDVQCSDCTESQHQANRRVEFKIYN